MLGTTHRAVQKKLVMVVDGSMKLSRRQRRHLKNCKGCSRDLEALVALHAFELALQFDQVVVPSTLLTSIISKLEIDRVHRRSVSMVRRIGFAVGGVVLAGAGLTVVGRNRHVLRALITK